MEEGYHRLKEAHAELRAAHGALAERAHALEAFVVAMTHDLSNPTSAIFFLARELCQTHQQTLSPAGYRSLERIQARAAEVHRKLHDLLEFFHVAHAAEPDQSVGLSRLIGGIVEELGPLAEDKAVRIRAGPLPSVHGQGRKLWHAFANLISNAITYAPSGCGEVEIHSAGSAEGNVTVCIRDNGIGIDPLFHEKIFDLFTRVPTRLADGRTPPGSGVGLAIVKQVIEEHGGRVWVDSAAGHGAAFYVSLPAARESPQSCSEATRQSPPLVPAEPDRLTPAPE